MNFQLIDWIVFIALFICLTSMSFFLKKFAKGVADFLVAGRNVGRYLGLESDSLMGLGAITILAQWQLFYKSGFVGSFWFLLTPLSAAVVALTGFGIYRFRQTRAMTLGQFIEMRYSKNARICFGTICYVAGVLNMSIFPITGANFFIHFCGLPMTVPVIGIPTSLLLMIIMVGAAVIICFNGGQVTLVVTNFVQALFVNTMLIVIMITIYRMFTWDQFSEAFLNSQKADALLHPFSPKGSEEFNKFFFLIGVWSMVYWVISWAPNTLVTSSARDAHEAKMMRVMVEIKKLVYVGLGIGILPLAAYVMINHPDFADKAASVTETISKIDNAQVRSQMITPAALIYIMPKGLLGAFAGFVLFAFLTTHTSYLLAWGGTLIQDVAMPLRGKPLKPKSHMWLIRISVLAVAVFIVTFSQKFSQVSNLFMFLDLTGGLYLASAGVILLCGLYWKRGTTNAAWAAMLTGAVLCLCGFFIRKYWNTTNGQDTISVLVKYGKAISLYIILSICALTIIVGLFKAMRNRALPGIFFIIAAVAVAIFSFYKRNSFPDVLDGRMITFYCSFVSIMVYFLISELSLKSDADLDEILHRDEKYLAANRSHKWYQFGAEVPISDRIIITCMYTAIGLFVAGFIGSWIYSTQVDVPPEKWIKFWHVYIYTMFFAGAAFMIWVVTGGFRDLFRLFRNLRAQEENVLDDGSVTGHHTAE